MNGLAHAVGQLAAHGRAVLEAELRARSRAIAIRAAFLVLAVILAAILLSICALVSVSILLEYYSLPIAASLTAALFLVLAMLALAIAVKVSFRRSAGPGQQEGVADAGAHAAVVERITADISELAGQLSAPNGRQATTLVVAALVAGVAVSVLSNRRR